MELRRYKDILGIGTGLDQADQGLSQKNPAVGFHIRNLEMSNLSSEAWHLMSEGTTASDELDLDALSALNAWNQEASYIVDVKKREFKIKNLSLNVTQVCNLQCKYCAAGGDGTYGDPILKISIEQTLPQIKFFMDKLLPGDTFNIHYLGGEPLLYPIGMEAIGSFARELAHARGLDLHLSVTTNGTLFNEKTIETLRKLRCSVIVSMDGEKEIIDVQRPSKDGNSTADKILSGLPLLFEVKQDLGRISFHGVYGKFNMKVLKAYEFFREFPVAEFEFSYDHLETSENINDQFIDQMTKVAEEAFNKGGEAELCRIRFFGNIFARLDSKAPVHHYCGAGQNYLMIDARNQIYTCPWDLTNPLNKVGQGTQLNHERLAEFQGDMVEKNKCQSCWSKNLCGGGCGYIHKNRTGNKNNVDSNFCKRTKNLIALALLYYQRCRTIN